MTVQVLNPDGIFKPDTYFQASIATGSRIICIAGQVALDESGKLVGQGNLALQAEQAYRNVFHALKGVGASFADVTKMTIYVPNWAPDKMEQLAQSICDAFDAVAPSFYSEEDRKRGMIVAKDRQGNLKEFPLLSVAIGICHNRDRKLAGFAQVAHLGAELKKVAKGKPGSAYVVDRRKD